MRLNNALLFFLILNNFENYNDNIVKQQYMINIIIDVINKKKFAKTILIFFSINCKF